MPELGWRADLRQAALERASCADSGHSMDRDRIEGSRSHVVRVEHHDRALRPTKGRRNRARSPAMPLPALGLNQRIESLGRVFSSKDAYRAGMHTNERGEETAMTIAVIGATGNTGRAVVKELRALGQNPICVIRNGEKAGEVLGKDAKTAVAELTDGPALEKALAGVQSVFVVTGHNPDMAEQQNNVLDAALKVGTEYIVRVSGARTAAKADSESVVGRSHAAINERLKASNIKWVILSPSMLMQNMLGQAASIKTDSKIVLPFANDLPVAPIDVRDTAAVGARILLDPGPHAGKTYDLTGKL